MSTANDTDLGFALEVTRFAPDPVTESFTVASLAEFNAALSRFAGESVVVFGLECDGGAGGAFYLFVASDRAWVHLTAGPCSTARSREAPSAREPVTFRLDNGMGMTMPAHDTVSREQGVRALRHWFETEQQSPELVWEPAESDTTQGLGGV